MAYVQPGVEVYEEILTSGGTNATLPTLPAVIVGPCYNVVDYTAGSPSANVLCFAGTLAATADMMDADFNVPSTYPGQLVDLSSLEVWTSNATVQTYSSSGTVSTTSKNVVNSITGQQAFDVTQGGVASIQPGFTVTITYSNGTTQSTTAYTPITATTLTLADTLSGSGTVLVTVTNVYNDLQIPASYVNTSNVGTNGYIILAPAMMVTYGMLVSGNIYIQYNALRQDITNQLLSFATIGDVTGTVGTITPVNRLAIGLQCALAATTHAVYGMAVAADDLAGYLAAVEALENQFVYSIVPLTQNIAVLTMIQANVDQMSLPANSDFRVVICNTEQATATDIGIYTLLNPNTGASYVANTGGSGYVFTASNATFISDGVLPSDLVIVTGSSAIYTVQNVVSNQELIISGPTAAASGVSYYIERNLTPQQMAQSVADVSTSFMDSRVWHVQPDIVGVPIGSQTVMLPGYYLACVYAGLTSGEAVQQSFTNLTVPGIVTLEHSNVFYTKSQLNLMAGAGTCLTIQDTVSSPPFCRHSLTTNMATVIGQEIMITKDVDAVAFYFKSLLKPFIGKWNVVSDTIHIIQQTVSSGLLSIVAQKLPQIGAPLRSGSSISSVAQNPNAADSIDVVISAEIPYPNNYTNIYLQV